MILLGAAFVGRELAELSVPQKLHFEECRAGSSLISDRRGQRVPVLCGFTNRYPSPSFWSGPERLRPEFFSRRSHRRTGADPALPCKIALDSGGRSVHKSASKNPLGGRATCDFLNFLPWARWSWFLPGALKQTANVHWRGPLVAPSRPTFWARMSSLALQSVRQVVPSATIWASATKTAGLTAAHPHSNFLKRDRRDGAGRVFSCVKSGQRALIRHGAEGRPESRWK